MKRQHIAYSLCGEGFGHYGRSIGIIKNLAQRLPEHIIDVYCYDYTFDMFAKDKELPANVVIYKIPGFRFRHNKKSKVIFIRTILFSRKNWIVGLKILAVELRRLCVLPIIKLFNKKTNYPLNSTQHIVRDFDLAIVDWEPFLPAICRLRSKKYISIDSIHLLEYAQYRKEGFTLKDWYYLIVNKILIKFYSPLSDISLITTIHNFTMRKKYAHKIYEIGPIVRKEMNALKNSIEYEDFILVYVRKVVRRSILPVLKKIPEQKFVVFSEEITEKERAQYSSPHIMFHDVDPILFVDYLRRCKAVLSTSGYTLISESAVLKKPFFAIVLGGILGFEQKLSLYSLQKSGCGDGCSMRAFKPELFRKFLSNIDNYTKTLHVKEFQDSTDHVCDIITEVLEDLSQFSTFVDKLKDRDAQEKNSVLIEE